MSTSGDDGATTFRGDITAAPLKQPVQLRLSGRRGAFRGDITAAPLKQTEPAVWDEDATLFPR